MSTTHTEAPANDVRHPIKRRLLLLGVPIIILLVTAVVYWYGGRYVETNNAYIKASKVQVSAEVSGTITSVTVIENQQVEKDQILFQIDAKPFQLAVAQAKANIAQVRTDLLALKANYHEKQAEIDLAQSRYSFAEKEQNRQANLAKQGFVSTSQLDTLKQNTKLAAQQIIAQKQDLQRLAETLGGDVNTPIEEHPLYRSALIKLQQAQLNLEHVTIRAPHSGTVSQLPNQGQYITAGHIALTLVLNKNLWIEANFLETDLTHIRPGQMVDIHVDTYPDITWQGEIESLSPATGSEFSILPAQNVTGNWVKVVQRVSVRIHLDLQQGQPPLRAGLSTIVKVDTGYRRHLPSILTFKS